MSRHRRPTQQGPLKILHVSGRSDHGGGPEHIYQIIKTPLPGIQHHIACPNQGIYWTRYSEILNHKQLCAIPHRDFSISYYFHLFEFCQRIGIHVLHSHGTCGGIYSRFIGAHLGLPVVHSFHGIPTKINFKNIHYYFTEGFLAYFTDYAVAVSKGEGTLALKRWQHYQDRLAVIPNGIDISEKATEGASWSILTPLRIVSFTRNNHQKNPGLLIEIAVTLKNKGVNFRIDAYGEGIQDKELALYASRQGISEHIYFHQPTDLPDKALAEGHIYLSTSRWEGMPLAVLEAWRTGLLVIATDVIGNRDLVIDQVNGYLYPSENSQTAADIICNIKDNPIQADNLRKQAGAWALPEYSNHLMSKRLEHLYKNLDRPHEIGNSGLVQMAETRNASTPKVASPAIQSNIK